MVLCVGAVVLHGNKVLFIRQTYGWLKGSWSIPWGYVEGKRPDSQLEPPHLAALRETLEEAGVSAELEGFLGIQNHSTRDGDPRLYLLYLCRHAGGVPTPDHNETDQAAYLSLTEMDNLGEPIDEFCYWIARRVLQNDYQLIRPNADNPYRPHLAFL
jgi:ADP-ribose pyrophosphatase YjhB (NUDIX family)